MTGITSRASCDAKKHYDIVFKGTLWQYTPYHDLPVSPQQIPLQPVCTPFGQIYNNSPNLESSSEDKSGHLFMLGPTRCHAWPALKTSSQHHHVIRSIFELSYSSTLSSLSPGTLEGKSLSLSLHHRLKGV